MPYIVFKEIRQRDQMLFTIDFGVHEKGMRLKQFDYPVSQNIPGKGYVEAAILLHLTFALTRLSLAMTSDTL